MDQDYLIRREQSERMAALGSTCLKAKAAHEAMADQYAARLTQLTRDRADDQADREAS